MGFMKSFNHCGIICSKILSTSRKKAEAVAQADRRVDAEGMNMDIFSIFSNLYSKHGVKEKACPPTIHSKFVFGQYCRGLFIRDLNTNPSSSSRPCLDRPVFVLSLNFLRN